jgi:hypothetical protein
VCAGGWGAHRDAGDTRARVRRAVGSRAAPLCVLSLFRLQTAPTERSLGVLLLVFDSEFPTVTGTLGLPSKDSLNVFECGFTGTFGPLDAAAPKMTCSNYC